MTKSLVVFDLDGTLIDDDSAQQWLSFLQGQNWPGADLARHHCDAVMEDYDSGQMNMKNYMDAWLAPLIGVTEQQADTLANTFTQQFILPNVFPSGFLAVDDHIKRGDIVLIISASPTLVVKPIAQLFGVNHVIGIDAVIQNGVYNGQSTQPFSFGQGKLTCLKLWQLQNNIAELPLTDMYSDSINDLPLLQYAENAHVINANQELQSIAAQNNWASYRWGI